MKIGIYCGSFDPPHLGHLILPSFCLQEYGLDKIIYVPSYLSVNKESHIASSCDRYNMLKLLIKNNPLLEVEKFEINKNTKTYTYETILYLKGKYGLEKMDTFLCIGSDWIDNLTQWKNFDIIIKNTNFIIFIRKPYTDNIAEKLEKINIQKDSYLILNKHIDISSSEIRNLIANQQDFSYLLTESVYKYIIEKGLYR